MAPAARVVARCWLLAELAAGALLVCGARREAVLATCATSLADRSPNQAFNALRAARALDGQVLAPGGEFSFNRVVGPWTRDRGYRQALVSYGGEMVLDYGGGVCQTSTTLYGAALRAGLQVLERDHHRWAPQYVEPGLDAAVAQSQADLRLRNPYARPVRLVASAGGGRLRVELWSQARPRVRYELRTTVLDRPSAPPVVRFERDLPGDRTPRLRPGRAGTRVRVERLSWRRARLLARETLSEDEYQPLGAITAVGMAR